MECHISGLVESVGTSTRGHPVAGEAIFCKLVSSSDHVMKSAPEMFEWSHVLNNFPTPITWPRPLRPIYDRDVSMHPSVELEHRPIRESRGITSAIVFGLQV